MATIKRKKVSTARVAKQKKNLLKNKLFWIISSIALVVIAAGIIIPIVIVNSQSSTTEHTDYFAISHTYDNKEIKFTETTYEDIIMHTSEIDFEAEEGFSTYQKHMFFFAFDLSKFYPDKSMDTDDTTYYTATHKEALNSMIKLQSRINAYNNTILNDDDNSNDEDVVYLYVIDLSKANNSKVVTAGLTKYFGSTDGKSFAFGYINGVDYIVKEYELTGGEKTESLYTNDMNQFNTTVCDNAIEFIEVYNLKTEN